MCPWLCLAFVPVSANAQKDICILQLSTVKPLARTVKATMVEVAERTVKYEQHLS